MSTHTDTPTDDGAPLEDAVAVLNRHRGGFNETLGLRFTAASADEVTAEVEIGPHLTQPYGIVHGGVYASIIETICSTAAALTVYAEGKSVVGLENSTSFLKATREGKLIGRAVPLARGRRSQVWRADITDEAGKRVASGQVRLLVLDEGATIAGASANVSMG